MPIPLPGGSPDSLFFLLIALVVNALLGGFSLSFLRPVHPEALLARLADGFDRRLNREKRSERNRVIRGALVVLLLTGLSVAVGFVLLRYAATVPFGRYFEIALLAVLIPQRQIFDEGKKLAKVLKVEPFDPAQASLSMRGFSGEVPQDAHATARLAIERLAGRFGQDVVAPVFWFVLLGLPGVFLSRAARLLGARIGRPDARHEAFGFAARRFDAALGFLPARLAGLLLTLAALFTPTANPLAAGRAFAREGKKHPDWSAGPAVAAAAGALDLALLGPKPGRPAGQPWIGGGRARATFQDARRALYLFTAAALLHFGLVAGLAYLA